MYIVVIGGGRIGKAIVERLISSHVDLLLIDIDEHTAIDITDHYGIPTVTGDGADPEILKKSKIKRADYVLIVTGKDKENLAIAMMTKKFCQGLIIVKANDERYISILEDFEIIEKVITPPRLIAQAFEVAIRKPDVKEMFEFDNQESTILEMPVKHNCKGIGKNVSTLTNENHFIAAVLRGGKWIPGAKDPVLVENDVVLSLTHKKEVMKQIKFYRAESRLKRWLHLK